MPPQQPPASPPKTSLFPLKVQPGIQRDGTQFASNKWSDGLWSRMQRGLPRKIGGYRSISESFQGPIRTVFMHPDDPNNRLYCGSTTRLEYADLTSDGIGAGVGDRTPVDLVVSDGNIWSFGELIDGVGGDSKLLAHCAPNLSDIASTESRKTWIANISGSDALVDSTAPQVSGGTFAAPPYAFVYGNDGYIANCVPNTPTDWSSTGFNEANVTKSKIVFGSPTRGGAGVSPAFLLWSLDSVLRATFVGGSAIFDFDTVSTQSSVLSSRAFIEYDGLWIWPGVDRFLMYNGIVQEIPNDTNINYFYDNLNWSQRQKVWATKVPRYGEVWIWFPFGSSEDCNCAIILNLRENATWYDTGIGSGPNAIMRVHGYYPQVFRWPTWADAVQSTAQLVRISGGTPASSSTVSAKTISSITWSTGVATLTTSSAHGLTTGWTVNLTGQTPAAYSGIFDITVTGATTFTYAEATDPGGGASVVGTYTVGDASFAFDGDLTTQTTQAGTNGNISIDYGDGVTKTVNEVGFRPFATVSLTPVFEYCDANFTNWKIFYTPPAQSYAAETDYLFPLNAPTTARGFRLRETGGAKLNIVELYFNTFGYMVHQHEVGVDRVVSGQTLAIPSYITTMNITFMADGPVPGGWAGIDAWVLLESVEVDFVQSGDMLLTVQGRNYAQSPNQVFDAPVPLDYTGATWKIDTQVQFRQMQLTFTTNQQGGDYQMGKIVMKLQTGSTDRPNNLDETA